jgi:hypothetical protein
VVPVAEFHNGPAEALILRVYKRCNAHQLESNTAAE